MKNMRHVEGLPKFMEWIVEKFQQCKNNNFITISEAFFSFFFDQIGSTEYLH